MVFYNLKVIVQLKEDINYENTYEIISNYIANAMLNEEELKKMHHENCYKLYTFCSLYPFEKEGVYKKNSMYAFDIHYINMDFGLKLKQLLKLVKSKYFNLISTSIQANEYRKINKLISLTPAICTTNKNDYKINGDLNLIKNRLIAGAEKKYFEIYNNKISCDFIKSIKQTNLKPIKLPYKNIHFLGNKFEIEIKEDEISQKLAFILLATGILEKNSQGYGFCKAR